MNAKALCSLLLPEAGLPSPVEGGAWRYGGGHRGGERPELADHEPFRVGEAP